MSTTSLSGRTGSPMSSLAAVMASPLRISGFSASPVSRMRALGLATVLPCRTTLMYRSIPSRVSVKSW